LTARKGACSIKKHPHGCGRCAQRHHIYMGVQSPRNWCNAMAFIPVPDTALVQLEGRVDGCVTINDLYFQITGGGITPVNLQALVVAVEAWWSANVIPALSEDWVSVRVVGTDQGSATGPRVESSGGDPGGVGGEAAPNNVAACISFRTAQRGRSARGRNFIPAVPNSLITLNTLDPTFITQMTDAYNELAGPGTFLAGWEWVVASRYTLGAPRTTGVAIPIVAATFTTPYVRSMRSREIGHGA